MECTNKEMIERTAPLSPTQVNEEKLQTDRCGSTLDVEQQSNTAVKTIAEDEEDANADAIDREKDLPLNHKCPVCLIVCKHARDLGHHLKTYTRHYTCELCEASFVSPQNLAYHVRSHLRIRPYQCPACNKDYASGGALRSHFKMHQGYPLPNCYSCIICSLHFDGTASLDEHLHQEHSNIPTHVCCLCGERFCTFPELYAHEATHLKSKLSERKFYANSKSRVKPQEAVHTCTACKTQFPAATELIEHMREHLPRWDRQSFESFVSLTCTVCEKRFDNRAELAKHLKNMKSNIIRGTRCTICSQEFLTHCHLTEHLHPDGLKAPRACDQCNEWYAFPCALEIHREKHFGGGHALEAPQQKTHQHNVNNVCPEMEDVLLDLVEIKAETCDDFEEFQFIGKKASPPDQIA